ncbi:MAG: hypothetical protein HY927_00955 [Elusimicrobia bacterium]|nr:hypothetical protein [Elusimicrobiota bacterium]
MKRRRSGVVGLLKDRAGSMLLETVLAMVIMTTVGLSLLSLIQKGTVVAFKAREQATCARMAQTGFARVKNVDFYSLFAADSNSSNYGLWAAYPYKATLDGIKATLSSSRFDRFRIQITPMRRDLSDANANGLASDLMPFTDADGDDIDDYDSNIRYFDQNADGDFYDTYASGGRTVAEQPDTHIKKVTFDVYRQGRLSCSQTELVSLEQFTGAPNPSSESVLLLQVSTPTNNAYLYRADTAALAGSRGLVIDQPYPSDVVQARADAASALSVSGETDPLAAVNLYVGTSGILDGSGADAAGAFSIAAGAVTANLVEGANLLSARAAKDGYTSPITQRTILLDIKPPAITGPIPSGTIGTLAPYVGATLSDVGVATTAVSGICPDVITFKIDGATVAYRYDPGTGVAVWIDSNTNTVPIVSSRAYTAYVEAGDYAGYKATQSWTFTLALPDTDNSAPAVSNKDPIGGSASSDLPVISARVADNQSGIDPASIRMTLDGVVVVDASTVGGAYAPSDGTVSYTPPSAFAPGSSHAVEIRAKHFAADPPDKVESVETWNFTVP